MARSSSDFTTRLAPDDFRGPQGKGHARTGSRGYRGRFCCSAVSIVSTGWAVKLPTEAAEAILKDIRIRRDAKTGRPSRLITLYPRLHHSRQESMDKTGDFILKQATRPRSKPHVAGQHLLSLRECLRAEFWVARLGQDSTISLRLLILVRPDVSPPLDHHRRLVSWDVLYNSRTEVARLSIDSRRAFVMKSRIGGELAFASRRPVLRSLSIDVLQDGLASVGGLPPSWSRTIELPSSRASPRRYPREPVHCVTLSFHRPRRREQSPVEIRMSIDRATTSPRPKSKPPTSPPSAPRSSFQQIRSLPRAAAGLDRVERRLLIRLT